MFLIPLFLPAISALFLSPQPGVVLDALWQIYKGCDLRRYMPENATGARIYSRELDPLAINNLYVVEYEVDFVSGINKTISRKFLMKTYRADGIWSRDMSKVGLIVHTNNEHHFVWSNDLTRTLKLENPPPGDLTGFELKGKIYAILQGGGRSKFGRWNSNLTGGVEYFPGKEEEGFFELYEPKGYIYYLNSNCKQFPKYWSMSFLYEMPDCEDGEGIFNRSKLGVFNSMSIFAYLTRKCSDQTYSNYWSHAYAKIQFFSRPIANTTTALVITTTTIPTSTTQPSTVMRELTTTETTTTTTITTMTNTETSITEASSEELVTSSNSSIIYMIIISILGVLCILAIIFAAV
ncbi:unnamed protein product [Bursaphelenchus xylophilus]|uniref:(pine wood nematode) hypothetical protein n=1 Tax=Bursaphelenchus xylophilus TaxID=6326 RepID=A0A1I7RUZ4_BURXY|nr:unnamed protein product [Bursaphelenchus xylophilus]CAG9105273.1 unnamed protein product [Bursaphelenchus xylophilus]